MEQLVGNGRQPGLKILVKMPKPAAPQVHIFQHATDDVKRRRVHMIEDFCIARFPHVPEK